MLVCNKMNIEVYTKTDCGYCIKAKNWLKKAGLSFREISLDNDETRHEFYSKFSVSSVPQIFFGKVLIGGFDDLKAKGLNLFRFNETYKPFFYPSLVDLTIKHEKTHWVESEIDLSDDVLDWKRGKVTEVEKDYITNILRLFTQSDVAVGQNYYEHFIPMFKNNEARNCLGSIACREGTHQRAYALLNDTLGITESDYHVFLEYKEMSDKIDFMMASDTSTLEGLVLALIKTVFNEGVSLFASFAMLINFQRHGKMRGMGKVVEWSIRDESIHVEVGAFFINQLLREFPSILTDKFIQKVYKMAEDVFGLEDGFIDMAYNKIGTLDGLSKDQVKEYVKFLIDGRLEQIMLPPKFGVKVNPISWLNWILVAPDHTNFFENKVTGYDIAGLTGTWKNVYNNPVELLNTSNKIG